MCLVLLARAVVKFFFCEQRALWKIQMASNEHFRKIQMAKSEHLEYFELLRKFSASRFLSFINRKRRFVVIANNRVEAFKIRTIGANLGRFNQSQQLNTANCALLDVKLRHVALRESVDGRSRIARTLRVVKEIY